ncbi:glycosyltransferase, partial [Pseudomonas fluorescens]|uniref:glycosyltransferase n=1 Tax=Pseudomonas fluorescens TaxID=294 RepID=UPI00177CD31E
MDHSPEPTIHILHINVRLNEGGAAKVALDIHRELKNIDGFSSSFAYGYSKGANKNPHEKSLGALSIANKSSVIGNWITYNFLNIDILPPTGKNKEKFLSAINSADIIHIHAIHSFFLPLKWFLDHLIQQRKKVVWTCHDTWLLTGRCAITDNCQLWKNETNPCSKCPKKSNYPSVMTDQARNVVTNKRKEINRLLQSNSVCFVTPSEHIMSDFIKIYPNAKYKLINNSTSQEP